MELWTYRGLASCIFFILIRCIDRVQKTGIHSQTCVFVCVHINTRDILCVSRVLLQLTACFSLLLCHQLVKDVHFLIMCCVLMCV